MSGASWQEDKQLFFLKKKNQKNFFPLCSRHAPTWVLERQHRGGRKSFFCFFLFTKRRPCFPSPTCSHSYHPTGVGAFHIPHSPSRSASLLALIGFVGFAVLVGFVASGVTQPAVRGWYLTLARPPGTPPNWAFPVVWSVIYVLIGLSAWQFWRCAGLGRALRVWGWSLALNAMWSPAFFGLHSVTLGLVVIVPLWLSIVWTMRVFAPIEKRAAWLLAPYLAWVSYAAYLNAGFWWLNAV